MDDFYGWYCRGWGWTGIALLSLPISVTPGLAQLTPAALPADPTLRSATPTLVTQRDEADPLPSPDPNAGLRIPPNLAEGLPIQRVVVYLRNPSGEAEQDEAWRQQLADTFRIRAGGNFSPLFADLGLWEVQQLPRVAAAEYRLYESNLPGSVIVVLLATLASQAPEPPPDPLPEPLPEAAPGGGSPRAWQ